MNGIINNAPSVRHQAQLRRVFVTGGSGFVGGALLQELQRRDVAVVALARSAEAEVKVASHGAEVCRTDLHDLTALEAGMSGCEAIIHAGSYLVDWDYGTAWLENVIGSRNVVAAAKRAGVRRIVYVSGIGVMLGSGPVIDADERHPRGRGVGVLSKSRIRSEREMLAASGRGIEVLAVRFPYVWGPGNTFIQPLRAAIESGRFRWINGGRHLISTVHIANAVDALILATTRGRPGVAYWVTDGPPIRQREFLEAHLRKIGVAPSNREISYAAAKFVSEVMFGWARLVRQRIPPALTPTTVGFLGQQITVDDSATRQDLGYAPHVAWPSGPM